MIFMLRIRSSDLQTRPRQFGEPSFEQKGLSPEKCHSEKSVGSSKLRLLFCRAGRSRWGLFQSSPAICYCFPFIPLGNIFYRSRRVCQANKPILSVFFLSSRSRVTRRVFEKFAQNVHTYVAQKHFVKIIASLKL
jgi:hypothetical protein